MQPVVTVAEMQAADAAAPVSVDVLIRRAGRAVANEAIAMLGGAYGSRVTVVAGKGNNGADGRAAGAVLARRGAAVHVVPPGGPIGPSDLVIDAAFGTGFRGSYAAPDPGGAPVIAVDIPSGVNGDTGACEPGAARADLTVTMAALKPGLLFARARVGRVVVADIGLPLPARHVQLVDDDDLAWLPPKPPTDNKWRAAVFIVAGSPGLEGAASLCARAAQRAGAGMVRVGSPGGLAATPIEAVGVELPSERWQTAVLHQLERCHALVVGPGLGRTHAAAVAELLDKSPVPSVVDADALVPNVRGSVVTPHDGEFERITGHRPGPDRIAAASAAADATGSVVLLKGAPTVVADPDGSVLLAASGDARLATAGTGDVLAGIIGAFLARGLAPARAAALAAHVHGRAAGLGHAVGLVASDIPDLVPRVLV